MTELAREIPSVLPPPPVGAAVDPMESAAAALRRLVERSSLPGPTGSWRRQRRRARPTVGSTGCSAGSVALARFSGVLGPSTFERDLLLLAAAVQLDATLLGGAAQRADGPLTWGRLRAVRGERLSRPVAGKPAAALPPAHRRADRPVPARAAANRRERAGVLARRCNVGRARDRPCRMGASRGLPVADPRARGR